VTIEVTIIKKERGESGKRKVRRRKWIIDLGELGTQQRGYCSPNPA
jgi:hypothetical protein